MYSYEYDDTEHAEKIATDYSAMAPQCRVKVDGRTIHEGGLSAREFVGDVELEWTLRLTDTKKHPVLRITVTSPEVKFSKEHDVKEPTTVREIHSLIREHTSHLLEDWRVARQMDTIFRRMFDRV